jgi:hypothetical protein
MALGGRSCRAKGINYERECVNDARRYHLRCDRVPLSGAGTEKGDIKLVTGDGRVLRGECKRKGSLPKWIAKYFVADKPSEKMDFVMIREDRGETFVIVPSKLFFEQCQ